MNYDTLIMDTPTDFVRLKSQYHRFPTNLPDGNVTFIGSEAVGEELHKASLGERITFMCEEDIIPFSQVHQVMKEHMAAILKGRDLPRGVTGWYYQQFLKMQYARICKNAYYMVWDGDTIPCRRIQMFDQESGKPFLDVKKEYHKEYFDTIKRLFLGMEKALEYSFISEHMIISVQIMNQMLEQIEDLDTVPGTAFWEKIIHVIPPEMIQETAFSEFETYGTYVAHLLPDTYLLRRWHSFRLGAEFFDPDTISDRDYEWLGKDFDAISFEKNQFVREDHKNLFDNPEYQKKLTARQMLEIAQEEFKEGYIEEWEEIDPLLEALKKQPE